MWVIKICKLCIYAGFNFIDQSEAVYCQRAGVCHLLCSRAVLTCILLLTLCTLFPTNPPTHPIVFPPCLRWHCLRWRRLLAGFFISGCLPVLAGCLPAYLRLLAGPLGCLPAPPPLGLLLDLGLLTPNRPAACREFGCLPMCVSVHQHI
jgi:hypothetical protein